MDLIHNGILLFIFFLVYQLWKGNHISITTSFNASFQDETTPKPTQDEDSNDLLIPLEKYKEYNSKTYLEGMKHYRLFLKYSQKDPSYDFYNHYIDKAKVHLKESMNLFQMMTIPTNETTKINFLEKQSDSVSDMKDISKIIKHIYDHGIRIIEAMIKKNKTRNVTNYSGFSEIQFPDAYNGESLHLYY